MTTQNASSVTAAAATPDSRKKSLSYNIDESISFLSPSYHHRLQDIPLTPATNYKLSNSESPSPPISFQQQHHQHHRRYICPLKMTAEQQQQLSQTDTSSQQSPTQQSSSFSAARSNRIVSSGVLLFLLAMVVVSTTLFEETRVTTQFETKQRAAYNQAISSNHSRSSRSKSHSADIIPSQVHLQHASSNSKTILQPQRQQQPNEDEPEICWLASYPNSGTSYTMTLVERASNLSTATNYGAEVTAPGDASLPLHLHHPEGPYWEGRSGKLGTIRDLPQPPSFVLTKTHCGGRCVHCGPDQYVVNTNDFLHECLRTSRYDAKGKRYEQYMTAPRVKRVVHLIRNPFHNIVARFHLERRHFVLKYPELDTLIPNNATGFQRWCRSLDQQYAKDEEKYFRQNSVPKENNDVFSLMKRVPCHAEFFKYAQWHERVMDMAPLLGQDSEHSKQQPSAVQVVPFFTLHYENYAYRFNQTVDQLLRFVSQTVSAHSLRPFRSLPTYQDHYSTAQQRAAKTLLKTISTKRVWKEIKHYFEDTGSDADDKNKHNDDGSVTEE